MLATEQQIDLEVLLRHAKDCLEDAYDILHSECDVDNDHARHDLRLLARVIDIVGDLQQSTNN